MNGCLGTGKIGELQDHEWNCKHCLSAFNPLLSKMYWIQLKVQLLCCLLQFFFLAAWHLMY